MEYSGLVQAIKENDSSKVDKLIKSLHPRLVSFLCLHLNASEPDAEDCAQESLFLCLEAIDKGALTNPELVFSYLMTTCKNNYLDLYKPTRERVYDEIPRGRYYKPDQLTRLLDMEKNKILKYCLKQLKRQYREFIEYWFEFPGLHAESIANHFGISINNAWTRKHRILKLLNECYKKNNKL